MIKDVFESDKMCGNCKHLDINKNSKVCRKGDRVRHRSYTDSCELFEFIGCKFENAYKDEEKRCYIYKFNIEGKEVEVLSHSYSELRKNVRMLTDDIEKILKKEYVCETIDFLMFIRDELPDVYMALRREYSKRKVYKE